MTREPASLVTTLRRGVRHRLGIDVRALAVFRVALGLLIVADLLLRSRDLVAFHTDAGVLPRETLAAQFPVFASASIHALSGSAAWQAALFLVAGLAAVAMAVGYRTRLATLLSAGLLASLQARNPLVLNGGDLLLLLLVVVAVFLPLGARWSIDALRPEDVGGPHDPPERVVSVATATLLVHVVVVYLANVAFKLRGDAWLSGEAVHYVFGLDQFTVLLGPHVAEYPTLLTLGTWGWFGLLVASPLLVLATGWRRVLVVAAFVAAHLGMFLTMRLGLFPFVAVTALLVFLPADVWTRVERAVERVRSLETVDDALAALRDRVPSPRGSTVPDRVRTRLRLAGRVAGAVFLVGLLLGVVLLNAAAVGYVDTPEEVETAVNPEEHGWSMFGQPPTTDEWYVTTVSLAAGGERDALHGGPTIDDRPDNVADTYPNARWRKLLSDNRVAVDPAFSAAFVEHLCWRAERRAGEPVGSVTVEMVEESIALDGSGESRRFTVADGRCGA